MMYVDLAGGPTVPGIGSFHPEIVHFVIALLFVGVGLRILTLFRPLAFAGPAASMLIVLGTVASVAAVKSGVDAHGPVERIPGARDAVVEHEEWGERARNVFLVVALLELVAVALHTRAHPRSRGVAIASAVIGLGGLVVLYEAAEHGGELVYGYAGGVGTRSGDPVDVNRLFIAGAYQQAMQDRQQGRGDQGASIIDAAAARFPDHKELQLLAIEWTIDVRKDPAAALQRLDALAIPPDDSRLRIRAGLARANALAAQGNIEGARAVLQTLKSEFPANAAIQRRLDALR
jgi:uncharacterized membrane protein